MGHMLFPKAYQRLRWASKKFTRKLSSCQMSVLLNLQETWLHTSWTYQKVTGKTLAELKVL